MLKCLQPCVTHVCKDTATSSSISETKPSPVGGAFCLRPVSNKVETCGSWLCLPGSLLSAGIGQGTRFTNQTAQIFKNSAQLHIACLHLIKYLKSASRRCGSSFCNVYRKSVNAIVYGHWQPHGESCCWHNNTTRHLSRWNIRWQPSLDRTVISICWWATVWKQWVGEWQYKRSKSKTHIPHNEHTGDMTLADKSIRAGRMCCH